MALISYREIFDSDDVSDAKHTKCVNTSDKSKAKQTEESAGNDASSVSPLHAHHPESMFIYASGAPINLNFY